MNAGKIENVGQAINDPEFQIKCVPVERGGYNALWFDVSCVLMVFATGFLWVALAKGWM